MKLDPAECEKRMTFCWHAVLHGLLPVAQVRRLRQQACGARGAYNTTEMQWHLQTAYSRP